LYPQDQDLYPLYPPSERCGLCQNFKQTTLTTRLYKVRTNLYPHLRRACARHTKLWLQRQCIIAIITGIGRLLFEVIVECWEVCVCVCVFVRVRVSDVQGPCACVCASRWTVCHVHHHHQQPHLHQHQPLHLPPNHTPPLPPQPQPTIPTGSSCPTTGSNSIS